MTTQTETSTPARGWVPDTSTFGARLALVRQREGWNLKEAALACNLPVQSWRGWEAGSSPRDLAAAARAIANRTGCDYVWLALGPAGDELPRLDSNQQPAGIEALRGALELTLAPAAGF